MIEFIISAAALRQRRAHILTCREFMKKRDGQRPVLSMLPQQQRQQRFSDSIEAQWQQRPGNSRASAERQRSFRLQRSYL